MPIIDDSILLNSKSRYLDKIELISSFKKRNITHAFHDIDGTHSLIRDWVPPMTLLLGWVTQNGLPLNIDSQIALEEILDCNWKHFPEAHKFSIESAGLSALTQMEWAIRKAASKSLIDLVHFDHDTNNCIIKLIESGEEIFDYISESPQTKEFINLNSSNLFLLYEKILKIMSRDKNLISAQENPSKWRVRGSIDFLRFLTELDIKNYFVTGAVVEYDKNNVPFGSMYEEIIALEYPIGQGEIIENLYGSSWNQRLPKNIIMNQICKKENINPENVLIVGDGRSEIDAGVKMGAVTISRLPTESLIHRELHKKLGTNLIISEYSSTLCKLFNK